ncbi:BON domain protein [Neorickettsia helminthoeca str. Oregon]|uniref:BON domain protein n=1 Tax=Neorickettsia helminthoeca str. Oregon TaxID=1286528 RepID=X5H3B9_9RICK|nr:BON domain-containing protein [Neorickettsia helminthoeca]AHX11031.1 BON domain protein [Neorickettsia helminthoeca str. Oregon]
MRTFFGFLLVVSSLSSCTPLLIGTTAATLAVTSTQEKSIGAIIDDKAIWFRVVRALSNKGFGKNITISVNEGRVLVSGSVPSSMDRIAVSKVIWTQEGVREVMNELQVEKREQSFAKSAWITAQIKLSMLLKSSVKSFNYTVETHDGTVYLLGIAQSKDELKKVYDIVRRVDGVKQVVSHVRLKNSPIRKM